MRRVNPNEARGGAFIASCDTASEVASLVDALEVAARKEGFPGEIVFTRVYNRKLKATYQVYYLGGVNSGATIHQRKAQ